MSSKSNSEKKSDSSNSKNDSNSSGNKITTYFSVLRPEGRAKMCATKTGDSKQKEILQKLKSKDTMTLRTKSEDDKSAAIESISKIDSPLPSSKEKLRGNISVSSALKTPLSQVLRKSIEASESKKELEKTQSIKEEQPSESATSSIADEEQTEKKEAVSVDKTSEVPKISRKAKKSFADTDSVMALRRSQKSQDPSQTVTSSLRSHAKRNQDGAGNTSTTVKRRVTVSEPSEVFSVKNSSNKNFMQSSSSNPAAASLSPTEEKEQSSSNQSSISSGKLKKNRKRHFRGGTYGLFLSKKKKKSLAKKSQEESKDDECSLAGTENSSYLDSDDGNSLMSEDLYTPSEKSLADEEPNPESRNSPMFPAAEPKVDVSTGSNPLPNNEQEQPEVQKEAEVMESVEDQVNIDDNKDDIVLSENEVNPSVCPTAIDEISQNATDMTEQVEDMQWEQDKKFSPSSDNNFPSEALKAPQYDDISNESFSNSASFPFKQSPTENNEDKVCEEPLSEKLDEKMDDEAKEELISEDRDATETTQIADTEEQSFSNIFENEENSNLEQEQITAEKNSILDSSGQEQDNESIAASMPTSGDEHDTENRNSDVELKDRGDAGDSSSTIATCVKSRQRIKRRFTDDIVDTDVGLLSLNSSMAPPRKVPPKPDPPKDVIQTFVSVTHSEAKKGPVTKIECIYNSHQDPVKSCTCEGETYEANLGNEEEGVFCQAVDSIDDKLVGCTNPVVTPRLVRSSVKIPFTIMCEMHLWRLKHHHSCPYCGLFCSQGHFMQCTSSKGRQKVIHLYHEQCQPKEEGILPFCLHCGTSSGMKRVQLEMHMASPPAFYMSQLPASLPIPPVAKAKMSFSPSELLTKEEEEDITNSAYKIEDTGKVLSSVGLSSGPEKDELERLLQVFKEEKIVPHRYSSEDFYIAAAEGDILKVLNILAQGIDPNLKFDNHEKETALHAAAAAGHTSIVHLLIQAGAVNDAINEKIYTPLMLAVENNHKDVVFYLIKSGACADFKGENGMSSFHISAKNGSLEILKMLMSSRFVDVNAQDDGGWTPIVWASEHNHYDVVKYLLKRGANPNIKDNEGNTGLHWSAFGGSVDICYLYLDFGCDINAVNERGDTPLHIAARQDSLPCVTLFLSRGADVQIKNKTDQIPAECVIDKNSDTYLSLSLNMLLKKISGKYQHKAEKILHRDISRGKEQIAIQCVNDVDDEPPPLDFLYVTENCETTPMNIDRTITSLQSCHCEDDCSTASCTCASISYQCWYDKEGLLLPNFNLADPPMLFECNRACSCWSLNCRNRVLQNGMTCRLQLIRTKGKGWGVRTLKDIPKGTFICEYVGEMISDSAADKRADDSYLFDLDNRDGETYCLDARYYGNISRFINHLCEPNLVPVKVYVDHQDLNFPRIAFFSSRDIKQYEELGFDYCEKFWVIKYKYFTCDCGSPKCKYSKDTIHNTLANYYRRVREEQMEEAAQQPVAPEVVPFP
ncbi:Histone-lysine N-methyltransferase EHMT1 like protein [Argiope bruennichi]|uniref:Histone-lysine N-methyltransferase EHMT1 like protein n=1 Tax=Argiope bruennichi TaxID=94029 RepID=A0A8T0EGX8_ARGBR|nr:Histone-lysine N-methyltransferase EHMT1 like protein [Argiope bruennichi]